VLYTIGRTAEYLLACALEAHGQRPTHKLGRCETGGVPVLFGTPYQDWPYPGGSVWASRDLAQAYLDERALHRFAVFGVDAPFAATADPWATGANWRDLVVAAPIRALEPAYYSHRIRGEARARLAAQPSGVRSCNRPSGPS
jgi:hypothetical protein